MSVKLIFNSVWNNPGNRGRRTLQLARAAKWQMRKRLTLAKTLLRLPNGAVFIAYPDCVISSALVYAEWPEYYELRFIRRVLGAGQALVDVGANVGHIALLLSDITGHENLYAFEPTPVSFQRLCENWKANEWPLLNLYQAAVGRMTGLVSIPDTQHPETKNSVCSGSRIERTVEVPLVSLDDYRSRWVNKQVGFVKVDVEGYETEVFAGAEQFLRKDRPRLIMFESLEGKVNEEISKFLADVQYEIFQLDDVGRPDFSATTKQNIFATPYESTSAICRCAGS